MERRRRAHVVDALLFYAGQVARRAGRRLPVLRDGRAAPPSEQLDNVLTAAHLLTGQLRDLGTERAWAPQRVRGRRRLGRDGARSRERSSERSELCS